MVCPVSVDRVRTSGGWWMCCAPAVSGQYFMLRSSGDCYDRMPQPGGRGQCDRLLDSCLSLNAFMAMCRLGKKDAERKRILRKRNENLEKRVFMYEGYHKRYQLQAPGRSRCYEFSSLNHDNDDMEISHWCSNNRVWMKHLSIFQPTMAIFPDFWLWVKLTTDQDFFRTCIEVTKAQYVVIDLDLDSSAQFLSFLQKSQCALFVVRLIGLLFNAVQWFLLQALWNPIHENPRIV